MTMSLLNGTQRGFHIWKLANREKTLKEALRAQRIDAGTSRL
jgi:hypothetical protein